ncbi:hypothetical protein MFUL124B02_29515 [Myxococcus fulvus 124B02]|nr:hypothetical protein MFUL124B02_29515 [Myxococcus fulvus 124B02]
MDAIHQALSRLVEELQWFVVAQENRALHVLTSSALRLSALEHVAAAEHDARNTSAFFILEAPVEQEDDGWRIRALELRDSYEDLRTQLARLQPPIQLRELSTEEPAPGLPGFARMLHQVQALLRDGSRGLTLVLAPVWVRDGRQWIRELSALLHQPTLQEVRWILLDTESSVSAPALAPFEGHILSVDARVDEAQAREDLQNIEESMRSAPPGASGAMLSGAAGPREAPPPRPRAAGPMTVELLRELEPAGIPPALLDTERMRELRILVLSAARAMREGDAARAALEQRKARDLAVEAQLHKEAVLMELMLAGYLVQGGASEKALFVLQEARARAEATHQGALAVQAQLSTGTTLLVLERQHEAAVAYAEAGRLGGLHDTPVLAIEGYRLSGQLLANLKMHSEATRVWKRALDAAQALRPHERRASSAPEAARALAALCKRHGLSAQATSLEAQAAALESGDAEPLTAPRQARTGGD